MSRPFHPHTYQAYCIQRLIAEQDLGLFLDMGLGKTAIVLTAINDLKYNRFSVYKVLVIAPKRVAETTWTSEAQAWDHLKHLRVVPVLGSLSKRQRALNTPADIYVINRENTQWIVDYYGTDWPFDMVVIDESSSFKNHRAKRFKALTWERGHIRRMVLLTGTPSPNGLLDLWAQLYLLDGGKRLGRTLEGYREHYFNPDQRDRTTIFSYAPKIGAEEAIQQKISDICISMKAEDYLDLPECLTVTVPVTLSPAAKKAYDKLERDMLLQVDEATINAGTAAVLGNKLLQLCNGALYDENKQAHEIHNDKIEAFLEVVEGLNGQHALVFYSFQHDRQRLLNALIPTGLRVRVYTGPQDGEDWNAGKIDILLAHPASTAYGLNLQHGGHHVIWFGLNWSLELYEQANKRLHRQGQTEAVIIHRLAVVGGVDVDVIDALEKKAKTQDSLMQAIKARIDKVKGVAA